MAPRIVVAVTFAALVVVTGCAVVHPPVVVKHHDIVYVEPDFYRELVEAGGVAVLPFLGGVGPEGIRNDASFELAQAYRRAFPRSTVITKDQLITSLRPSRLDEVVDTLVRSYERTNKLNPSLLLRLEQGVSVRYLVYGRLDRYMERDRNGIRQKEVVIYSELWDLPCKTMVWSGTGSQRVEEALQQTGTPMGELFVGAAEESVAAVTPSTGQRLKQSAVSC